MTEFPDRRKRNLPVDKLESDRLPPPPEVAEAEYFIDMAFDDRLLMLLEGEASLVQIDMSYTTSEISEGIASYFFQPNTAKTIDIQLGEDALEELEIPALAYRMHGCLQLQPTQLIIDAQITPEENRAQSIRIQNDPQKADTFYSTRLESEFDIDIIDTKELFSLLCQLGGASKQKIDQLLVAMAKLNQDTPQIFRTHIAELWQQLGESHGETLTSREMICDVTQSPSSETREKIKLRREELEKTDGTFIRLYLEHANEMTGLDVEESHCLTLTFEQQTERNIEKKAERIIISGISPRLISIDFERKSKGKVKPLDLDNITIKELFVDWFDKLISH